MIRHFIMIALLSCAACSDEARPVNEAAADTPAQNDQDLAQDAALANEAAAAEAADTNLYGGNAAAMNGSE